MDTFDKIFSLATAILMTALAIVCTVAAICGYWWQGFLAPVCALLAAMYGYEYEYRQLKKSEE